MTYYVTVENGTANRYKASVIGWPHCVAEGKTREEAVTLVKRSFVERLNQVEIVPIEVDSPNEGVELFNGNPTWTTFSGMYANNPLFEEVLASIQEYRQALDQDETVI